MTCKAIIEMPKGTKFKYEFKGKKLVIDRVLDTTVPFNYGFIPKTLCDDGDPLDVFVISDEAIVPGTIVKVIPKSVIRCMDNGKQDDKIIAVLSFNDRIWFDNHSRIMEYLSHYKEGFHVLEASGESAANRVIEDAKELYHNAGYNG